MSRTRTPRRAAATSASANLCARAVLTNHVALEMNVVLRLADGLEPGWIVLTGVLQQSDMIALHERGAGGTREGPVGARSQRRVSAALAPAISGGGDHRAVSPLRVRRTPGRQELIRCASRQRSPAARPLVRPWQSRSRIAGIRRAQPSPADGDRLPRRPHRAVARASRRW